MSLKIEKLTEQGKLGEGPFWDHDTNKLYLVDIILKTVQCYDPTTKTHSKALVGDKNVSFIIPIENEQNKFLIGYGNQIAKIEWDGTSDKISKIEVVVEIENTQTRSHRWNDGKVDPSGRLWAGVMLPKPDAGFYPNEGTLYALLPDKTLKTLETGITLTNGLAWDVKLNKFYYIDTMAKEVYQYDYDDAACAISNKQVIFNFDETNTKGLPDGMTIDAEGNIYVAAVGSGKILKINPRKPGQIEQEISMPATQVTSVEFGGENYEDLFVTTAKFKTSLNPAGEPEGPEHGATYVVRNLGVRGLPGRKVRW